MTLAYFPYSSSRQGVGAGRRVLTFPEVNVSFRFFTIGSIFPRAITHFELALHIQGKLGGKNWGLNVVSNPPLNMNEVT